VNTRAVSAVPGVVSDSATSTLPWYRQVTRDQWRAFWAVFLGWIVDSFDFNILAFIVVDIQKSFTIDRALAGALGTVTLIMRLVGGTLAGTAADKWGRKLPLMLSVLWFSLFAFLSGFAPSYAVLFGIRALFGLGMGGEWAAGMPLVLEHWPARLRGLASGLMLGGWYWGYLFAAAAFQFIYPLFSGTPDLAWRVMFWVCVIPALFTFWIRARVPESPVWLERQRLLKETGAGAREPKLSLLRIFQSDMISTTIQTTLVIGSFMCIYYSLNFWYPTVLRDAGRTNLLAQDPFKGVKVGAISYCFRSIPRPVDGDYIDTLIDAYQKTGLRICELESARVEPEPAIAGGGRVPAAITPEYTKRREELRQWRLSVPLERFIR